MKKLLLAILAVSPLTAFAADPAQVLKVDFRMMEGGKEVGMAQTYTVNGAAVPFEIATERTYIAKATKDGDKVVKTQGAVKQGMTLNFTPTILKGGKIDLGFSVKRAEIDAIYTVKQEDDLEVQLPQVTRISLEGDVIVAEGKEFLIPFGPFNQEVPPKPKYQLKFVVTKSN